MLMLFDFQGISSWFPMHPLCFANSSGHETGVIIWHQPKHHASFKENSRKIYSTFASIWSPPPRSGWVAFTLPKTNSWPLKIGLLWPFAPKGNNRIPIIHFQVAKLLLVSERVKKMTSKPWEHSRKLPFGTHLHLDRSIQHRKTILADTVIRVDGSEIRRLTNPPG